MGLFSKNKKIFYTILLDREICKFFFREIDNKRRVVNELFEFSNCNEIDALDGKFASFITKTENKQGSCSILDTDIKHNFIATLDDFEGEKDDFIFENIDKNFIIYYKKNDIKWLISKFGVEFDEYILPLKMLYFLLKNQECNGATNAFVLKFQKSATVIICEKNNVKIAEVLDYRDLGGNFDDDDIFYEILKLCIDKYYINENADFIDTIYIYGDEDIGNELGYLIFTKLYITTKVIPLNFIDFINKMAIKSSL